MKLKPTSRYVQILQSQSEAVMINTKLWVLALAAGSVTAQTYTGSIRGRAADPAGLPIPNATVTLTEVNTNAVRGTATNGTGDYIVNFLKPGDYRIEVSAQG